MHALYIVFEEMIFNKIVSFYKMEGKRYFLALKHLLVYFFFFFIFPLNESLHEYKKNLFAGILNLKTMIKIFLCAHKTAAIYLAKNLF